MDAKMPEVNNLTATRNIHYSAPNTRVKMFTMFDNYPTDSSKQERRASCGRTCQGGLAESIRRLMAWEMAVSSELKGGHMDSKDHRWVRSRLGSFVWSRKRSLARRSD